MSERPIRVAIIGGGCAGVTAAFELTRPEHRGRFDVTTYQLGWRFGGKGASGRGPGGRIEEHGLHVWLGFYENAFRVMRDCYAELNRDPRTCPVATWRDAFFPEPLVGVVDKTADGRWSSWMAHYRPTPGDPGDPLDPQSNPFSLPSYLTQMVAQLRATMAGIAKRESRVVEEEATGRPVGAKREVIDEYLRYVKWATPSSLALVIEGLRLLETVLRSIAGHPSESVLKLIDLVASGVRDVVERMIEDDDETRRMWALTDVTMAILRGCLRHGLLTEPRGFDVLDEYELRDWLRMHGASERSIDSAFIKGLYDLALAYVGGEPGRARVAAGQGLRGAVRMFLTYRGMLFWKMRAGMGDIVFAPFYEVLKRRGARCEFFHRLEKVRLVDEKDLQPGERPYVEALEFDVQAEIAGGGEYQPLVDYHGLPCWPSGPDWSQLEDGERLRDEGVEFESWFDQRKVGQKTLRVGEDFDYVVLAVGGGAVEHLCGDLADREPRWRAMLDNLHSVASQAFQTWMREDMKELGWPHPPVNVAAFEKPYDTWADMSHLIPLETMPPQVKSIAYFCGAMPCPEGAPDRSQSEHRKEQFEIARQDAVEHLNQNIAHIWRNAAEPGGGFRWEVLVDPDEEPGAGPPEHADESRMSTQFWTANVSPTDRYVLTLPGTVKYRISPLDNTFDNFTIAGDWTASGFASGCVESAVMSGRLAAHALSGKPRLEDIIGYDHP